MKHKIVLITGGSSGIGLAIAEALIRKSNWTVLSLSRSAEKIERAKNEFPELCDNIRFLQGDVSSENDCDELARTIGNEYGELHGLVNNAGVVTWGGLEVITPKEWDAILRINLTGPFLLTKALLPLLKRANGASVINISSIASKQPGTSVAYSVSKAGLDMLTEYLAGDLGPYKIRVNAINPGLVKTNLHLDNKVFTDKKAYLDMLDKARFKYPIGRIGTPRDVAALAAFLLSDESSWITGTTIKTDGGVTLFNDLIPPKRM